MQYHPDKQKGLCLNDRETVSGQEYILGDVKMKEVSAEKDLGVTVGTGSQIQGAYRI